MTYVHPAFVGQLVTAGAPIEDMLRATVTTLVRAFDTGVHYGNSEQRVDTADARAQV